MLRGAVKQLAPVNKAASGGGVYERFCAEPETLAVAVVDDDGAPIGIVERNSFFLKMAAEFGRALYGGRPITAVMDPEPVIVDGATPLASFVRQAFQTRASDLLHGFIVTENGRYFGVGATIDLLIATNAENLRRAAEMERLAEEHRLAHERADEAHAAAEAANRAKSEFLANMSHEIRTPLNGVVGVASALARTDLDGRQREMVGLIESSAETLQILLSDILDLARVEAGKLEIASEPFDLVQTVGAVAELFRPKAEEKALVFELYIAPVACRTFRGDAVRLKQILGNLLSNAIKFTAAGRIALRVDTFGGPQTPRLRFTVEDTGIGFDDAARQRLFSRFEQADGSVTRQFGGSGLGLSISRTLAEMMGGGIDAESAPGAGSRFWLDLALTPCAEEEKAVAETPADLNPRPLRVLLAEDHPVNRKVIELMFDGLPINLVMAENGRIAVDAFATDAFDAVLMDMQMPQMDGLEATRAIRAIETEEGRPRTPIIMLSANALPEHRQAGQRAGADLYLTKPIAAADLFAALDEVLGDGEKQAA